MMFKCFAFFFLRFQKNGVEKNLGIPKTIEYEAQLIENAMPELQSNIKKGIDFMSKQKWTAPCAIMKQLTNLVTSASENMSCQLDSAMKKDSLLHTWQLQTLQEEFYYFLCMRNFNSQILIVELCFIEF